MKYLDIKNGSEKSRSRQVGDTIGGTTSGVAKKGRCLWMTTWRGVQLTYAHLNSKGTLWNPGTGPPGGLGLETTSDMTRPFVSHHCLSPIESRGRQWCYDFKSCQTCFSIDTSSQNNSLETERWKAGAPCRWCHWSLQPSPGPKGPPRPGIPR